MGANETATGALYKHRIFNPQIDHMPKFKVDTTFLFRGIFEIEADSIKEAQELIESHTGLVLGGGIHTTLPPDIIDWDFPSHPTKNIVRIIPQ